MGVACVHRTLRAMHNRRSARESLQVMRVIQTHVYTLVTLTIQHTSPFNLIQFTLPLNGPILPTFHNHYPVHMLIIDVSHQTFLPYLHGKHVDHFEPEHGGGHLELIELGE